MAKAKKEQGKFVNVLISEEQYAYLKKNCINMRQYLRRLLDEDLEGKIEEDYDLFGED